MPERQQLQDPRCEEFRLRRAVEADYEAVLNINRNVYAGLDYMSALYFVYLQDHQHVIYVLEGNDGQLVH